MFNKYQAMFMNYECLQKCPKIIIESIISERDHQTFMAG